MKVVMIVMNKNKCCCTYCAWLSTGNGIYCGAKEKELSYNYARYSYHKCNEFEFNEINAFDFETIYKPKESKIIKGQIQLKLGSDNNEK